MKTIENIVNGFINIFDIFGKGYREKMKLIKEELIDNGFETDKKNLKGDFKKVVKFK